MRTITNIVLLMAPVIIVYAIWFATKDIEKDKDDE